MTCFDDVREHGFLLLQGFDRNERKAERRPLPILIELGAMQYEPLEHRAQCVPGEPALDDPAVERDGDLEIPVLRVEMRWEVITVVHADHDPEEPGELWHEAMLRPGGGG